MASSVRSKDSPLLAGTACSKVEWRGEGVRKLLEPAEPEDGSREEGALVDRSSLRISVEIRLRKGIESCGRNSFDITVSLKSESENAPQLTLFGSQFFFNQGCSKSCSAEGLA
jgi:hypothetical protein